jgi:hypothetical protein
MDHIHHAKMKLLLFFYHFHLNHKILNEEIHQILLIFLINSSFYILKYQLLIIVKVF